MTGGKCARGWCGAVLGGVRALGWGRPGLRARDDAPVSAPPRPQEDAILAFSASLVAKPDYSEAYHNRGVSLKACGRQEEALASFRGATEHNPSFYLGCGSPRWLLACELGVACHPVCIAYSPPRPRPPPRARARAAVGWARASQPCWGGRADRGQADILTRLERYDEAIAASEAALAIDSDKVGTPAPCLRQRRWGFVG